MRGTTLYIRKETLLDRAARSFGARQPVKRALDALLLLTIFGVLFIVVNIDFTVLEYKVSRLLGNGISEKDLPQEWLTRYSIVITDRVDPQSDADGDTLSFLTESKYGTNPFGADTDADGASDGDEIQAGTNPLGQGELDTDQDGIPDTWESANGLDMNVRDDINDPDSDGLENGKEFLYGTNPYTADTDGDGFSDSQEIQNGYDPAAPGDAKPKVTVLIQKISVAAPLVWTEVEDQEQMLEDLKSGVIRYPGTGVPGQNGNLIISGHSSNYAWAEGDYNSVFRELGKTEAGDTVTLRVAQANGKTFEYRYAIQEKRTVAADDPWIFEKLEDKKVLSLSTCWPVGTALSRLVVRAELLPAV